MGSSSSTIWLDLNKYKATLLDDNVLPQAEKWRESESWRQFSSLLLAACDRDISREHRGGSLGVQLRNGNSVFTYGEIKNLGDLALEFDEATNSVTSIPDFTNGRPSTV